MNKLTNNESINNLENETIIFNKNILVKFPSLKEVNGWKSKKIENGVFVLLLDGEHIDSYRNLNGELILDVNVLNELIFQSKEREISEHYKKGMQYAGYLIYEKNGEHMVLKIKTIDNKSKKIVIDKKVERYSKEEFNAYMDIAFFCMNLSIILFHKESTDGGYTPQSKEGLEGDIKLKVLKIKDLYSYYENGQINEELFKKLLPEVQSLLLEQIADSRLERVKRQITKEELDFYMKEKLISKELYDLAIQELKELEELKRKKEDEKKTSMKKALEETMNEILWSQK